MKRLPVVGPERLAALRELQETVREDMKATAMRVFVEQGPVEADTLCQMIDDQATWTKSVIDTLAEDAKQYTRKWADEW